MTKCDPESPTIRETASTYRGVPIIVEIHPRYTTYRVKGKKTMSYNLAHDAGFERAMKNSFGIMAPPAGKKRITRGLVVK